MLSPEYYEGCADDIIELYEQLEDDIISDVVRRIVKNGKVTETAKHQIEQLQESGLLYDDILNIIAGQTDATSQHVKALFEDAGVETVSIDNEVYRKNGLTPVDIRQSPAMRQTLEAGYRKTLGSMKNLTMTTANTSQTAYINACNQAYMQVTSGAFSYQEAIKQAVQMTAKNGATVLYPSGHTERLDVAVRRAVLTGVGQTCREIGIMNAEECGCDLMEISAHSGARPDHAKWQGQLVSLSGKNAGRTISGKKVLTLRQIGYGQGDGFGGWNCRHDWYPFFEEYSTPNYSKKELQRLDEKNIQYNGKMYNEYEISQIQRRYEREIRSAKREQSAFKVAVSEADDPELKQVMQDSLNYANSLVKDKQAKMRDFIKQTGQDRDYFREQNYPKENSRNNLTYIQNSDKIEDEKNINFEDEIFYFDEHKEGYEEYLKNVPDRHQKALRYASENCPELLVNDNRVIYAYHAGIDALYYNPEHPDFKSYDFNTTYTHELSHYLDHHFCRSFEDKQFIKSISENSYSNQHIQSFIDKYGVDLKKHLELSDIVSALTINKFKVLYGHPTTYWLKENAYNREKEVFVNIFNLEAQNNNSDIDFLQSCFPDVWVSYVQVRNNGLNKIIKECIDYVGDET